MTRTTVAVTGFGLISPLGRGADANSSALQAGVSGVISQRPYWAECGLRSQISGKVDTEPLRHLFDRKQERFLCESALLSCAAMHDAIQMAGLSDEQLQDPRTGVIIGTGAGSSVVDAIALAERLRKRGGSKVGAYQVPLIMGSSATANAGVLFRVRGHSYGITSACSTSAHSLMLGLDLIRSGRQDRIFAGGAEDVNIYSAAAFDGMNALSSAYNDQPERASRPLDRNRDGFVFSGGAGVLLLEDMKLAVARGAKIWAILEGAAATSDGEDMVVPNGKGAIAAMELALQDAEVDRRRIDYINLHGTSTPVGDVKEIEAIRSVFGDAVPPFSSTKSMTGHALGAAGALEAIFCILMMRDNFLAPNINLDNPEPAVADLPVVRETQKAEIAWAMSNSFGFGGTNCALVFSHPDRRQ
ncbi:MAG: beta-ketoacyl-ACP synthase I [Pirellulaceae bacterium]|nr:beta-ketoacyl-ACP synthase I [Pirellulaceae bacterium]